MKPTTEFMETLCRLYIIFEETNKSKRKTMELALESTNKEFNTNYQYEEVISEIYNLTD